MTDFPLILPNLVDSDDKSSPLKNTIRNNYKHLKKWAKRTHTDCFRIYDKELHHYQLAIDVYAGRFCIHFFSRKKSEEPSDSLVNEVSEALCSLFETDPKNIFWRKRIRRGKYEQYEKSGASGEYFTVYEYGLKFRINLTDYLDTGLFLDHRETRKLVGSLSQGKRVLNLFAYTCAFSIHAAAGGAAFTKSVDLSNTYTKWGRENFHLNSFSRKSNEIVRDDCLKFLDKEIAACEKYDLIIIDPPTLSRSKKMDQMFDVQVDYITLLSKAMRLLNQDGILFFSTNSRRFQFDEALKGTFNIRELTPKTIPQDFHDKKIHRCWKLSLL